MAKIRKVQRKKRYLYNVNRKRMNKKKLPGSENAIIKKAWNKNMSSAKNFKKMGLVFDVNSDIQCMNKERETKIVSLKPEEPSTSSVVEELQKDVKLAKESRTKNVRLPKDQVDFLMYLLDKYGDDYKAMSRDKKNYLQQTWKQLRYKINLFKSIPVQYNEYLNRKN